MRSAEQKRLEEPSKTDPHHWKKWGPYVAERAWGTVREDYSADGNAWNYFPFWDAHKRAYRWGEDGIAGWCDRYQVLVFAPAFWNGRDPILKERHFGLTPFESNHGEDVKECYFYVDGTPTHSYMKYLYKYPQSEFPYQRLKEENARRRIEDPEFELIDTGIFENNRYFDIFIEYAKASPEDTCIRIEAFNRGPEAASLHILPHLWFRNQWSWGETPLPQPQIAEKNGSQNFICLEADDRQLRPPKEITVDYHLGKRYLYGSNTGHALFTNNESAHLSPSFAKDAFHRAVIHGENCVNPQKIGTKAALHYFFESIPAGQSVVLHLRLTDEDLKDPLKEVDRIVDQRKKEADQFYQHIHPKQAADQERTIQREAIAGMLWSKQIYLYDVSLWLRGDNPACPPPKSRQNIRNIHWKHLNSMRILSMPDKWEYPWFAAWDLAFHTLTLGLVDIEFAKEQLWLLLFDQFQHPNGQIPAYEWEFSDLNPPIQAWAALRLYQMQKEQTGKGDVGFLNRCFLKLMLNFIWWVNRVDSEGFNVFEGGFLGLDNIAFVDRSIEFEDGGVLKQSDGTAWMAMFCLNLMRMALELAKNGQKGFESVATKFFEHFVYIAHAMKIRDNQYYKLWCDQDGFFYDALSYPNGTFAQFKIRSLVGIIPLYATELISQKELDAFPEFKKNFDWFFENRKHYVEDCIFKIGDHYLLSLVNENQLQSVVRYIWDPEEFRSPFGLRSLSKHHEKNPYHFNQWKISYEPGVGMTKVKGGNSNWRGPIWMPTTYLLIESLRKFAMAYGEKITISVQKESAVTLKEIANGLSDRLVSLFLRDQKGVSPVFGSRFPFVNDPYWKHLLFYEYYHGETGEGLGASHQTGWSALVANLIDEKF